MYLDLYWYVRVCLLVCVVKSNIHQQGYLELFYSFYIFSPTKLCVEFNFDAGGLSNIATNPPNIEVLFLCDYIFLLF